MAGHSASRSRLILVQNRAGISVPFRIETLATSLLVAGVDPPDAYAIASRLETSLELEGREEIASSEIAARVADLLEALVDPVAAERFRAWRRFRLLGRPLVLCLMGAPGVGKSTAATGLSLRLGIHRVVSTESVREVLRTVIPSSALPELHRSILDTGDGFLRQARAVGSAAAAAAAGTVHAGRSILLVGAHLAPGETRSLLQERGSDALVVEMLLVLDDERLHRARMLRRLRSDPTTPAARHLQSFHAVRALQARLDELARQNGVVRHDLAGDAGLAEWVVDHVVAATG